MSDKVGQKPTSRGVYYLYTLAIFEGAGVMAAELISAKAIAPFFGNSLYVWAAVLGVTLTALMSGYYLGGWVSHRFPGRKLLFWILVAAGVGVTAMPYLGAAVMRGTMTMSVQWGATLSLLVFLFPWLLLMGMSSPMVIARINTTVDTSGRSAGAVYAISTFGGIVATFVLGFWMLPELGIRLSALISGGLLAVVAAIGLFRERSFAAAMIILPIGVAVFSVMQSGTSRTEKYHVRFESEGVLGQVRVIDLLPPSGMTGARPVRTLVVNNKVQTVSDGVDPTLARWQGALYFPAAVSMFPEGSDALILGLGGGTYYHQFSRLGFNVASVELDARIVEVAHAWFSVPESAEIIIDDARHFLNVTDRTWDIVALDLFHAEVQPAHVLTKECFSRIGQILRPGGVLVMNGYGYLDGPRSGVAKSLIQTLKAAEFEVVVLAPGDENDRNLTYVAGRTLPDISGGRFSQVGLADVEHLEEAVVDLSSLDLKGVPVLVDDRPILEHIGLGPSLTWRRDVIEKFARPLLESGIPAFQ